MVSIEALVEGSIRAARSEKLAAIFGAVGAAVALPLLLAAILATAGGHGSYLPFQLSFPLVFLVSWGFGGADLSIAIAVLQFVAYGVLLGAATKRSRLGRALLLIALWHCAAASIVARLGLVPGG